MCLPYMFANTQRRANFPSSYHGSESEQTAQTVESNGLAHDSCLRKASPVKPGAPRATSYSQGFSISKIFNYILKFFWPSAKPKCSAVRQESKKENISKETVFNKVASLEEGESLGGPRKAVNNLVSYLLLPKAFISPEGVNKKIKEAKIAIDAATASLSGINDGEKRAIQNFVFREILTEACKELLLDDRRKIMDALGRKMI